MFWNGFFDLMFGGPESATAFWFVPYLIVAAATAAASAGVAAHQSNIAKKDSETQQRMAKEQAAQQAKEAEELAKASRKPTAPKSQTMAKQSTPRTSKTGSLQSLSIRGRAGKSALRIPRTGTGVRIPS